MVKSNVYKLVVGSNNYPVEAYSLESAISALARKLAVNKTDVFLSNTPYKYWELSGPEGVWKNPYINKYESSSEKELESFKLREQAQADLNALLRGESESPKVISDGKLDYYHDYGDGTFSKAIRPRVFYSTMGYYYKEPTDDTDTNRKKKAIPNTIFNNRNYPRKSHNRPFLTDTNDKVFEDITTVVLPNTDFVFPLLVDGKSDQASLDSVFRFRNSYEAYEYVKENIIKSGIENMPHRNNPSLTYMEMCDGWLAGTNIALGTKNASQKSIDQYNIDMSKKYNHFTYNTTTQKWN